MSRGGDPPVIEIQQDPQGNLAAFKNQKITPSATSANLGMFSNAYKLWLPQIVVSLPVR
jgi:hypothetical protein